MHTILFSIHKLRVFIHQRCFAAVTDALTNTSQEKYTVDGAIDSIQISVPGGIANQGLN